MPDPDEVATGYRWPPSAALDARVDLAELERLAVKGREGIKRRMLVDPVAHAVSRMMRDFGGEIVGVDRILDATTAIMALVDDAAKIAALPGGTMKIDAQMVGQVSGLGSDLTALVGAGRGPATLNGRSAIDTTNDFLVGRHGEWTTMTLAPAGGHLTRDQALRLAAWLVMLTDLGELDGFAAVFAAVRAS